MIKIGPFEFDDCPVLVDEHKALLDFRDRKVEEDDGAIGMDVFRQYLVTLHYPRGKLKLDPLPTQRNATAVETQLDTDTDVESFFNAKGPDLSAPDLHDRYIAPEMQDYAYACRQGHFLIVPVRLTKDKFGLMGIDTGSYETTMTMDAAKRIGKVRHDSHNGVYGISGVVKDLYYLDRVTLNFARLSVVTDDVVVMGPADLQLDQGFVGVSGLIGASALNECVIHLDYRDGLVKFQFSPGPSRFAQ